MQKGHRRRSDLKQTTTTDYVHKISVRIGFDLLPYNCSSSADNSGLKSGGLLLSMHFILQSLGVYPTRRTHASCSTGSAYGIGAPLKPHETATRGGLRFPLHAEQRVDPRACGPRDSASLLLSPAWAACCSPLPPPVLGPLIKAGLSATAAHQGAPHPHLQQQCLLGFLL
ncbi:hypothetical protein JOB18_034606 [Solea senegalensis]|uniref:Uncharacterized protein n=1 Tax=Solea senegalensis TaxID=28829 RepID=A0AAV6SCA6_SOLSE|nr:hypothetical protein JOB18_034606 [Solea senegalensis]